MLIKDYQSMSDFNERMKDEDYDRTNHDRPYARICF